jgi:CHAT domain-containing protein
MLPQAAVEASEVASMYPQHTLLIGPQATRRAFLRAIKSHRVLHFAGHAVVNPEVPALSRLALASETGVSGDIYAFELDRMSLPETDLVILAACDTAGGRTYRSSGVVSLARAFITAGVAEVIATLWRIQDETARPIFHALHEQLRAGLTPSAAIRVAQLRSLSSDRPELRTPASWATVVDIVSHRSLPIRRTQ